MSKNTVVASLDVVVRILEDPDWNMRAERVKTLEELRQVILDFCEVNGIMMNVEDETLCT